MTLHLYDPVCGTCRYWSQMLAKADSDRGVEAVCLHAKVQHITPTERYTVESHTCDGWASNHHGAVDEPPDYGESARAAYAREAP